MPCFNPLHGHKSADLTPNGKRKIVFGAGGFRDLPVTVPCGQCIGCRLERSRQWAVRLMHEAQLHDRKCFLTLTYDPENLPPGGTLVKKHFQDFMKRLRKYANTKIRFFHCGEYGDQTERPHYHAIIYGYRPTDLVVHNENGQGDKLYISEQLAKIWGHGQALIGEVSFESAAYTARYILKKVTGERAQAHYRAFDPKTGEVFQRLPPYVTMSRRPGIARGWFDKFSSDVYPSDFIVIRGRKMLPPRFYDRVYAGFDLKAVERLKFQRQLKAKSHKADNTPQRLRDRQICKESQISTLKRKL